MRLPALACLGIAALLLASRVSALPADFERTAWVTGLNSPLAMKFAPDGRLFFNEQAGGVRIIKNGVLLPTPFATVNPWKAHRESMVGLAFDPHFAQNGYLYLLYGDPVKMQNKVTRITASKANPDVAEPGSEVTLLEGITDGGYVGGAFVFGKDGMLYIGSGHGGSQDMTKLYGKVLRINPAGYPGSIIPADNPFVATPGARGEIWALGFREPFTGAADTVTGDIIFNDVGESYAEELDLIKKGANYGWEGGCEGNCTKPGMENPLVEILHVGTGAGNCITGGAFYYGASFPSTYHGGYFYSDWGFQWIKWRSKDGVVTDFDKTTDQVIQLDVGLDGSLYALKIEGQNPPWKGTVQRIRYTGAAGVSASVPGRRREALGPEEAIIDPRLQNHVIFHMGDEPVGEAVVRIYEFDGRMVRTLKSSDGRSALVWDLAKDQKPGAYFYSMRVAPRDGARGGAPIEKQGRLFIQ